MLIQRALYAKILERLSPGKAVILLGPRQAGKSTILEEIGRQSTQKVLRLDCDDSAVRMRLEVQQLPNLQNLIGNADPTRADYGFGLGVAVRRTEGIVRTLGSVGDFGWAGAYGTNWWADPKEELAVVFMAHSPGPIRWHYRQLINALVLQALN